MVRLTFHRLQRSLRCNDRRLHQKPMPDIYGMKTAVFAYHPLKTTLSNYLRSTHLDDIYLLQLEFVFCFCFCFFFFLLNLCGSSPSLFLAKRSSPQIYLLGLYRRITVTDDTSMSCLKYISLRQFNRPCMANRQLSRSMNPTDPSRSTDRGRSSHGPQLHGLCTAVGRRSASRQNYTIQQSLFTFSPGCCQHPGY